MDLIIFAAATSGGEDNGLGGESAPVNDYLRPSDHSGPYLVGPMVIRVFPDGRPVPGDAERPLPQDEDVDELKYSRIPSVSEIEASSERFFYKKPTYHVSANKRGVYVHNKPVQRPSLIATTKGSYYRGTNPLFRERRVSDVPSEVRSVRFY